MDLIGQESHLNQGPSSAGPSTSDPDPTGTLWDEAQIKEAVNRSLQDQGPPKPNYKLISPQNPTAIILDTDLMSYDTLELPINMTTHIDIPLLMPPTTHGFTPSNPQLLLEQSTVLERR
ncbi:hypothetical protein LXL04_028027 [Taraxacum kok-saghyz]